MRTMFSLTFRSDPNIDMFVAPGVQAEFPSLLAVQPVCLVSAATLPKVVSIGLVYIRFADAAVTAAEAAFLRGSMICFPSVFWVNLIRVLREPIIQADRSN